jgi:ATP adenylyltransferase
MYYAFLHQDSRLKMERLWTPWRMTYVSGAGSEHPQGEAPQGEGASAPAGTSGGPACFLCAMIAEDRDEANLIVHRAELGFIVLNLYPYNSGHVMVAPYTHVGDLALLPPEVGHALFDLTRRAVEALRQEYRPDGFNVGLNLGRAGGAGLPEHLHIHVVPRWHGDTNFMPVLGQTKVLPEALDQTLTRLRRRLSE